MTDKPLAYLVQAEPAGMGIVYRTEMGAKKRAAIWSSAFDVKITPLYARAAVSVDSFEDAIFRGVLEALRTHRHETL